MKKIKYVQVVRETGYRDDIIANFEDFDEGAEFTTKYARANGFIEAEYPIVGSGYEYEKGEEYLALDICETIVYESVDEYIKSINYLTEISKILGKRGIKSEIFRDKLSINYKPGYFYEVDGTMTIEEIDENLKLFK